MTVLGDRLGFSVLSQSGSVGSPTTSRGCASHGCACTWLPLQPDLGCRAWPPRFIGLRDLPVGKALALRPVGLRSGAGGPPGACSRCGAGRLDRGPGRSADQAARAHLRWTYPSRVTTPPSRGSPHWAQSRTCPGMSLFSRSKSLGLESWSSNCRRLFAIAYPVAENAREKSLQTLRIEGRKPGASSLLRIDLSSRFLLKLPNKFAYDRHLRTNFGE
jgi:hypothetical protein